VTDVVILRVVNAGTAIAEMSAVKTATFLMELFSLAAKSSNMALR
jgi:hypothetical protein